MGKWEKDSFVISSLLFSTLFRALLFYLLQHRVDVLWLCIIN
jgi:hypothetical protein